MVYNPLEELSRAKICSIWNTGMLEECLDYRVSLEVSKDEVCAICEVELI